MKALQRVETIAGIAFVALVAAGCTVVLRPFVTAILWAAVLCYSTWPLFVRIQRALRGRRTAAALLMTLLIAGVMVLPFAIVGMTFAESVTRLVQRLAAARDDGLPAAPAWVEQLPLIGSFAERYWTDLSQNTDQLAALIAEGFDRSKGWLLRRGMDIGMGIFQLSLSVLVSFFFYRDGERLAARVSAAGSRLAGDDFGRLLDVAGGTIKGVVYGILGTALAQGIMAAIGFMIAGFASPFLLGLLTFFLSLVPVGPPLLWVPATVWLFYSGHPGWGVFMGLWGAVGISGIDNLVRPYLISRGTRRPFVLVLMGVLGGVLAFGFIGVFLGPTLLAVGYSMLQEFAVMPKTRRQADAASGPGPGLPSTGAPSP